MRMIFRAILILAVLAMVGYFLGFWSPDDVRMGRWRKALPTTGPVEPGAVRDGLDQLGEQSGRVVQKVDDFVSDAGLSAKIKSKMALDDVVRARAIDVSTADGVVTLAGTVRSVAERDQALRLARDTTGVTRVVDNLVVSP